MVKFATKPTVYLFGFFLLSGLVPVLHAEERCGDWAAQLESVEGRVEWHSHQNAQWQTAAQGFVFCYGDRVRVVEQRAALRLANETLVRLQENSLVTLLPEEKGFWFELLEGAGHFLSRTPKQFTIKAPYLNAAVDGTEFVVSAYPQTNQVAVLEGNVRVNNSFGEVRLQDGMQTHASAATAPNPAQTIRLRDAAEWILYYPPLIVQLTAPRAVEGFIINERYGDALDSLLQNDLTAESTTLAASLALNSGQPTRAEQLLQQALDSNPQQPDALALKALRTLINGDNQSALQQTRSLLQAYPNNASVLLAHAYALQSQGEIEEALEINQRAQTLAPDNLFVLARTAELELSTGNTRAAQKLIDRALKQAPQHSRVNTLAGFIALNRFATGKARNYFQTAIKTNSSEPLARLGLALALIQQGKIERGREQMEMAVLLDPGSSLLRSYLGKTYATQNQNAWADTQYQLAKNLDPNDPTPWFYEGLQKQQQGELIAAVGSFQKSRELNDNRAVYRSRLYLDNDSASRAASVGRVYNALGFTQRAIELGSKAISESPGEHSGHRLLAEAYAEEARYESLRASERLQATMLQPFGTKPLPLGLSETGLLVISGAGPADFGINEYNYLFTKEGFRGDGSAAYGSQNTRAYDLNFGGYGNRIGFDIGHYRYGSDGFRENNDVDYSISSLITQWAPADLLNVQGEIIDRQDITGDLGLGLDPDAYSSNLRKDTHKRSYRVGANITLRNRGKILASIAKTDGKLLTQDLYTETEGKKVNTTEISYILQTEVLQIIGGVSYSKLQVDTYDSDLGQIVYEEEQTVDEYYLYTTTNLTDYGLSIILGSDFYRDDTDIILNNDGIQNKNRRQALPKIGLSWKPFESVEIQTGKYETFSRQLSTQTTLKPTHIYSFPQIFDGTNGTHYTGLASNIIFTPTSNLTLGMAVTDHKLMEPTLSEGDSTIFTSRNIEDSLKSAYINWYASRKISIDARYLKESTSREADPSSRDPFFPINFNTTTIKLKINYSLGSTLFSISANNIHQNYATEGVPEFGFPAISENNSFRTVDLSVKNKFLNSSCSIDLSINNIFDKKFQFANFNIYTAPEPEPRTIKLTPERTIQLSLTLDLN